MKRLAIVILLLSFNLGLFAQQENYCTLGIEFDISYTNNWGASHPVIRQVYPYSPAAVAGVMPYDIILEINGISTQKLSEEEMYGLINEANHQQVSFTLKNLINGERIITLNKDCKPKESIRENQLAVAFSMYSLEDTNERSFICPFKTTSDPKANFLTYKTFAFSQANEGNIKIEAAITEAIEKELVSKGLKRDILNPDLLIQTYYMFDKNPAYRGSKNEFTPQWRFDGSTGKMKAYPFFSAGTSEAESEFYLQYGIKLIDAKTTKVIWECEANELLKEEYKLDDYVLSHTPLMMMQYPLIKYRRNVPFRAIFKQYNYTGIGYNIDKLNEVMEVIPESPAYRAGIRPGDLITRINGLKTTSSSTNLTNGYKRFITETFKFRDESTKFTDANGFPRCMYWNTFDYPKIATTIQKTLYQPDFSYLYFFRPYINPEDTKEIIFEVKRGSKSEHIMLLPEVRNERRLIIE